MSRHVINKQLFDFTCSDETAARQIQKEFIHYAAPKLNEIIAELLEKHELKEHLTIEKLEIDLGNLRLDDFGNDKMLNYFKEQFAENLEKLTQENENHKKTTIEDAEFELIKTFLLVGDLPWWADKTQLIDLDILLKNQLQSNTDMIKRFFENHRQHELLWQRLSNHFHAETQSLVQNFLPFFNEKDGLLNTINFQIDSQKLLDNAQFVTYFDEQILKNEDKTAEKLQNDFSNQTAIIKAIIEHPYFFKHHLFEIFERIEVPNIFTENEQSEGKKSLLSNILSKTTSICAIFIEIIKNLPTHEKIIWKAIIQKKAFETIDEKAILIKIFGYFPAEIISFLQFFTHLSEEEIQQFLFTENSTKPFAPIKNSATNIETLQFLAAHSIAENGDETVHSVDKKSKDFKKIYIENAGLCLVAPYLPALFKGLEYLEEKRFKHKFFAHRAIHLLNYISAGRAKAPEYLLQLNKILCGFEVEDLVLANIELTNEEMAEADSLIESVISHWQIIKNTTPDGLRGSFLQRKGILSEKEKHWVLQIERQGFDMLLDSIPWGFSMIKLPWMTTFIQVEW